MIETQSVEDMPVAEQPKQTLKDAQICISCQVVRELPKGKGLEAFYCENCHKTFQHNLKIWKQHGLAVTKRTKEAHDATRTYA